MNTYTQIDSDIVQCNDCGAHSYSEDTVKHHPNCDPGEREFWEDVFEQDTEMLKGE